MDAKIIAVISTVKILIPTVVGAVLGWFLAVFTEPVRRLFFAPRLQLKFEMKGPFLVSEMRLEEREGKHLEVYCFYFRIGVRNIGNTAASKLRVLLTKLETLDEEGNRRVAEWFVPVGLDWCHGIGEELPLLNPGATFFFDFGTIKSGYGNILDYIGAKLGERSDNRLVFKASLIDAEKSKYFLKEGRYRIGIQVSGDNSQPVEGTFEFYLGTGLNASVEELVERGGTRLSILGQTNQSIFASELDYISSLRE